ncbi:hypothetical protein Cni_G26257 [Canna indica]|uniref:MHD2 domain-containing protein n=1 Tax=Canna indica TaxID=4628 RepID=A0AAQ3KZE1_9LILI|nr:hypothetical protein Cni_G26257 [Canna indica]
MDLIKLAKVTADEFFEIPVGVRDDMVQDLTDGLEALFRDYITFISACGMCFVVSPKQRTQEFEPDGFLRARRNEAKLHAKPSTVDEVQLGLQGSGNNPNTDHPRSSTSRGTQRLYIRLNTLYYLLANLYALDKSLTFARSGLSPVGWSNHHLSSCHHFEHARSAAQSTIQYVSKVGAHRLIFLDSRQSFYDGLYVESVANARIHSGLRIMKQNLALLVSILTNRAQPMAVKEVMRAAFEAFLMVLLARGTERAFVREDAEAVLEDFLALKWVFCSCGEATVAKVGRQQWRGV